MQLISDLPSLLHMTVLRSQHTNHDVSQCYFCLRCKCRIDVLKNARTSKQACVSCLDDLEGHVLTAVTKAVEGQHIRQQVAEASTQLLRSAEPSVCITLFDGLRYTQQREQHVAKCGSGQQLEPVSKRVPTLVLLLGGVACRVLEAERSRQLCCLHPLHSQLYIKSVGSLARADEKPWGFGAGRAAILAVGKVVLDSKPSRLVRPLLPPS